MNRYIDEHDELTNQMKKLGQQIGWYDFDGTMAPLEDMLFHDKKNETADIDTEMDIGTQMLKISMQRNKLGKKIVALQKELNIQ